MYEQFYDFQTKPFELVPNPRFLYQGRSHKKALNYLQYGLLERAGFILLTGEVGSGKTTIVRNLIKDMDQEVALSMLFNTKVSNKQVLAMINEDFGLNVNGKDKITLLRNLNDFLLELHSEEKHAVVIIDEAQNLSSSALEEIRLLSNLEATDSKLLQIVLVGQPELKKTLARDDLRQLRQRISVHCQIDPLTRQETEDYVYHRLQAAGNRNALSWGEGTFDILFRYSNGIPRLINVFCDFILLAACAEENIELASEFVQDVIEDVAWDKHVAALTEDEATPAFRPGQGLSERLRVYEQKLAALESLLTQREETSKELRSHKELLLKIIELQNKGFRRMEDGLERTCQHLQMYLTGTTEANTSEIDGSDDEEIIELTEMERQLRKGLLGKLFS